MSDKSRQRRLAGFEDHAGLSDDNEPSDRASTAGGPGEATRSNNVTGKRQSVAPQAMSSALNVGGPRLDGQRVYVLDCHSLIYQVFHALPEMSGPAGQPVGAIHGFLRDVVDDSRQEKAGPFAVRV